MALSNDKNQPIGWPQWLLIGVLVLSLVVAGLFATRGVQQIPRRQVDEPIHAWMSLPYIARSYRVPPSVLYAALGLPAEPPDHRPIMAIARAQNRPPAAVIADLQTAIRLHRPPYVLPSPSPARSTP